MTSTDIPPPPRGIRNTEFSRYREKERAPWKYGTSRRGKHTSGVLCRWTSRATHEYATFADLLSWTAG
jgi:hypothetical protein